MATLKSAIYTILETDAKLTGSSNLGYFTGLSASAPYGVYFRNPPEGIDFTSYSIITYFISAMGGRKPRDIYINITAWGAQYENILERVYDLLHNAQLSGLTDYANKMLKWNNAGPELFDDDRKIYYQQHRYLARAWKI